MKDIERIQKRAMKIVRPELDYHQALAELNIKSLADHRDTLCIQLIKDMSNLEHRLHYLLQSKVSHVNHRDTSELKITGTLPEAENLKPNIWWNHQAPAGPRE